jgi:chorismate lyase
MNNIVTQWRRDNLIISTIPLHLRSLILEPNSMTQRLRALSNGTLKVKVLQQGWGIPTASEKLALHLPQRQMVFIREVILFCFNKPWLYGRSVFPLSSLSGKNKFLLHALDERPLGDLLFRDPHLHRSEFEIAKLSNITEYQILNKFIKESKIKCKDFWGRRCEFVFNGKPFLLTEVFLPSAINHFK